MIPKFQVAPVFVELLLMTSCANGGFSLLVKEAGILIKLGISFDVQFVAPWPNYIAILRTYYGCVQTMDGAFVQTCESRSDEAKHIGSIINNRCYAFVDHEFTVN